MKNKPDPLDDYSWWDFEKGALVVLCLLAMFVGVYLGQDWQKTVAIKAHVAEYKLNTETGNIEFNYK